jgi:hypothetical protein
MAAPAIRNVYVQLRQLLGDRVSSSEALHFAAKVVQFCLQRRRAHAVANDKNPYRLEERAFETWPIDVAMEDGGWRILEYEMDQFRPDVELGRVHVYQTASLYTNRVYAAEGSVTGFESERILRSLEWLLGDKRSTNARREESDEDSYPDFDD